MYRNRVHITDKEHPIVSTVTTYTNARAILAKLCDKVAATREPVIIKRRGAQYVALVSAEELAGVMETAQLLRSPKNAERLLNALARARGGKRPRSTVEDLRRELGLEKR
jgi:antitoxin YefM